jgi:hypothetical protein
MRVLPWWLLLQRFVALASLPLYETRQLLPFWICGGIALSRGIVLHIAYDDGRMPGVLLE